MTIFKDCEGNREIFKMLNAHDLREFNSTYLSLATVLTRLRRSTRTRIAFAKPPRQTTIPEDPNRSGGLTSSTS